MNYSAIKIMWHVVHLRGRKISGWENFSAKQRDKLTRSHYMQTNSVGFDLVWKYCNLLVLWWSEENYELENNNHRKILICTFWLLILVFWQISSFFCMIEEARTISIGPCQHVIPPKQNNNKQTNKQTNEQTSKRKNERTNERTNERKNEENKK